VVESSADLVSQAHDIHAFGHAVDDTVIDAHALAKRILSEGLNIVELDDDLF
jgi:hypothetical protein